MKTLAWQDGELYDVAAGWQPISGRPRVAPYGDQFDTVTVSPAGDVVALTATTEALLVRPDGNRIRELGRARYHADAYRYPLALFTLPDGRTGLVHCPEHYNQLEIEDAVTGERLTTGDRTPVDFFHSRLAVSPSGRYLLSAGWVWHPWGCLAVYDLAAPALDTYGDVFQVFGLAQAEVAGACFVGEEIVLSTTDEPNEPDSPDDLAPVTLARWSPATGDYVWRRTLDAVAGDLVPFAGNVLALHNHPRLFDANTGELLAEWPTLTTGAADSAIVWKERFTGAARTAIDPQTNRLAITDGNHVTVVEP